MMEKITVEFRKDLDHVLAQFVEENVTVQNRKTLTDFNIMEFIEWVSKKINLSKGDKG